MKVVVVVVVVVVPQAQLYQKACTRHVPSAQGVTAAALLLWRCYL